MTMATLVICWATWVMIGAEPVAKPPASPLSPEIAQQQLVVAPGLRVELVAAEPQVVDPVSIRFGADGSLWVVELRDYPYGPRDGTQPKSQIVRLRDADGDGRYESSLVFADQLLFVTGVAPYRDGLIVTLAGEIVFLADRDGDGRAEFRETWFRGFAQENSQLRANHPIVGADGWVYVANGLRGGKIVPVKPAWKKSDEPLVITGFDFRFHPETGEFGTITGHGQFGQTFDDVGRRFVCSNRNPCQHVVLDDVYLKRNPSFAARQVMHDVCAPAETSRLYPLSVTFTTSTTHTNQFTAACGVHIYGGDALPTEFRGNAFTCDPTGNLVHREVLTPSGATFMGKSPYDQREFLATTDTWFRPVDLADGPDGALYVVDMYRAVIEHPDWMPTELRTRKDLMLGNDRGRIWRVVPADIRSPARRSLFPAETKATPEALAGLLFDTNAWHRSTSQRLLLEHRDPAAIAALRSALTPSTLPAGRVLALQGLAAQQALTKDDMTSALTDAAAEVRETALRLSEQWLSDSPELLTQIAGLTRDPSPRVRFQAALTLSAAPSGEVVTQALSQLVAGDVDDAWLPQAMLIATRPSAAAAILRAAISPRTDLSRPGLERLIESLGQLLGREARNDARDLLGDLTRIDAPQEARAWAAVRWALLRGLTAGLARHGQTIADLMTDRAVTVTEIREWQWQKLALLAASDPEAPEAHRLAAIRTAAEVGFVAPLPFLSLAFDDPSPTIQMAAFEALARSSAEELTAPLLEKFPSAVPAVRRGILDALLANEARSTALLAALERGDIKPAELDAVRQGRLTQHRDPELKARAAKVFAAGIAADRQAVLTEYDKALTLSADAVRGKAVFEKQCVTCHRVANIGVNVGPDIGDTYNKTPVMLLTSILDPNRAVDNGAFGYIILTEQGQSLTGLIVNSTATSITLRQPEGKEATILRSDIEELRSTGLSLMPVGLEKNITVEQMADLLLFLKNWRYLDGAVPLGDATGK